MRQMISRATTLLLVAVFAAAPLAAMAAGTTGIVTGVVQASSGAPLGGAAVELTGPSRLTTTSDAHGTFTFAQVPTGMYSLQVSKAGYNVYRNDSVAAFIGETTTENVTLSQASFSSLKTIGAVSTTSAGTAPLNTSTAAIDTISSTVFDNQGTEQVAKVLNETPGIFTTPYAPGNGNPSNGASPGSEQTPQIRGALPYETESLIDGHPVSVGSAGTFSPNLINPFLLQSVELVKGPGSMPVEINYAINGTVNYITLQPTATAQSQGMIGMDKWGGVSAGFKATGELDNHKLGYALGYVSDGAPGPLTNFRFSGSQLPLANGPPGGPFYVNGRQLAMLGTPIGEALAPPSFSPYAGMGLVFAEPLVGCCYTLDAGYHATSELGKILYNFSNNTSLQFSYFGGQSVTGNGDVNAYDTSLVGTTGTPAFGFQPCGTATSGLTCNPFATGTAYNCKTTGGGPGMRLVHSIRPRFVQRPRLHVSAAESLPRRVSHDARLDGNDPRALLHRFLEQLRYRGIVLGVECIAQRLRYRSALPGRRNVRSEHAHRRRRLRPEWLAVHHQPRHRRQADEHHLQRSARHVPDQQPGESVHHHR